MLDTESALAKTLSKIPLFFGLEPNELKIVLAMFKSEAYTKEKVIFKEDDPSHDMYIVLSGEVDIKTNKNGVIFTLGSCDIFGEIGLITQRTRSASAVAHSDCSLLKINHVEFNLLSGKRPRISSILMKNISTNLANHVVRMNNAASSLEHIPQNKDFTETGSQILSNTPS